MRTNVLVTILVALLGLTSNAQEFNKISSQDEALKLAQELASQCPKKLRLLKAKDFTENSFYIVRFVPVELTDLEYDKLEKEGREKFFTVRFYYWNEGENKDLELKGTKKYKLSQVTGSYLQLFPIWKKYIKTDADLVVTQASANVTYRNPNENKYFVFMDEEENWIIMNRS